MSWQPELDELKRRQEMAHEMGGADKVKRQHDGGRLTVRERISARGRKRRRLVPMAPVIPEPRGSARSRLLYCTTKGTSSSLRP